MTREEALNLIADERNRQIELQQAGKFQYTLSDNGINDFERSACIVEEVGELCKSVLNAAGLASDPPGSVDEVPEELTQIAALSLAWLERFSIEPVGVLK